MTLVEEITKRLETYLEQKKDLESQLRSVEDKILEFQGVVNKIGEY